VAKKTIGKKHGGAATGEISMCDAENLSFVVHPSTKFNHIWQKLK